MPCPCDQLPSNNQPGRRTFLSKVTYGAGAIAAAMMGIPFVGYLFGTRKGEVDWVTLGPVKEFPLSQTRQVTFDNPLRQPWDGMVGRTSVFVRNEGSNEKNADASKQPQFLVLAANCAHLGCPVEWFQESGLFMCPCHGGVYYANGERASGPPPRGLYHCVYRVTKDMGIDQLQIQAPHFPTLQNTLKDPA
jgi:Rieske Fe-S protein